MVIPQFRQLVQSRYGALSPRPARRARPAAGLRPRLAAAAEARPRHRAPSTPLERVLRRLSRPPRRLAPAPPPSAAPETNPTNFSSPPCNPT
ncbi:MAG: hypothetical protein R3F11_10295 [Verrucomicrobiales bacterium]